jgi:hypothetical protein
VIGGIFVSSIATVGGGQWWQTLRATPFFTQLQDYVGARLSTSDSPPSIVDVLPFWRR